MMTNTQDAQEVLNNLNTLIKEAIIKLKNYSREKPIRVISHYDADGISSAGILIKALKRENFRYVLTIVQHLTQDNLMKFSREDYDFYIFLDLGTGMLQYIHNYFSGTDKIVVILDHHKIDRIVKSNGNILLINPRLFTDEENTISGAGLAYLFSRCLNEKNIDLSPLAIVGALGDVQEVEGELIGLNRIILEEAERTGHIRIEKSLKLVGLTTKYLHKVLEQSKDIEIEGVTGSESGAIQFLKDIGINPMGKNGWIMYHELTHEEKDRLITSILMHKPDNKNYSDLLMNRYIIPNRPIILGDARDLATALNGAGRLGKASIGIAACLGKKGIEKKLSEVIREYRQEIVNSINWAKENLDNKNYSLKGNGYLILNAKNNIKSSFIGVIISILLREINEKLEQGTNKYNVIAGLARQEDGYTKISIRQLTDTYDLKEIMDNVVGKFYGISGGHKSAAGGLIKTTYEEEFIKQLEAELKKISIEQNILIND